MEFTLNKSQRLVINAASGEDSRPVLNSVHIKKGIAECTDGFILVQKKIDYDGDEELLIDARELAPVKDMKSTKNALFNFNEGKLTAIGAAGHIISTINGNFPNTDQLWPKEEPVFKIALNRNLLLKMAKCIDNADHPVKLYFYDKSSPVKFVVDSCDDNVQGLIMPMHVSWPEDKKQPKEEQVQDIPENIEVEPEISEVIEQAEQVIEQAEEVIEQAIA